MRIFKNKPADKAARKLGLSDADFVAAVVAAERGLVDAYLGGGVIKQRIARQGEGKSGGFRSIILLKSRERAIFVYVFAKNAQDNITMLELAQIRRLAPILFALDDSDLTKSIKAGELIEVYIESSGD